MGDARRLRRRHPVLRKELMDIFIVKNKAGRVYATDGELDDALRASADKVNGTIEDADGVVVYRSEENA
jgi:hypothetical protein